MGNSAVNGFLPRFQGRDRGTFQFPLSTTTVQRGGLFIFKSRIIGLESKGNASQTWSGGYEFRSWAIVGVLPLPMSSLSLPMYALVGNWERLDKPRATLNEKPSPTFYWLHTEMTQCLVGMAD